MWASAAPSPIRGVSRRPKRCSPAAGPNRRFSAPQPKPQRPRSIRSPTRRPTPCIGVSLWPWLRGGRWSRRLGEGHRHRRPALAAPLHPIITALGVVIDSDPLAREFAMLIEDIYDCDPPRPTFACFHGGDSTRTVLAAERARAGA